MVWRVVMAALAMCCEPRAAEVGVGVEVEVEVEVEVDTLEFDEPLVIHGDALQLPVRGPSPSATPACRSTTCPARPI